MAVEGEGASYAIDLKLCYTGDELGAIDESTIHAYRWDESAWAWEDKAGTVDAGANCVTVTGVTELSVWTLAGDNQAPTALTLRGFATDSALWGAGLLIALAAGLVLIRRRKTA